MQEILPMENTWIIFPGWLAHRSRQLPLEEPRYVVSGNLYVKVKDGFMKRAIFTFYNLSLDTDIVRLQAEVVKFNTTADFLPLCSQTHGEEVIHPDAVDYGFNQLFVEKKYDTVLLLDVDCIPLNAYALEYTFEQAEKGKLIGNVQRGMHLDNDEHNYVAPSAFCLTRQMYEDFGRLTVKPDHRRGDCCGYYTYAAQEKEQRLRCIHQLTFNVDQSRESGIWERSWRAGYWYYIFKSFRSRDVLSFILAREQIYNVYFYDKCEEILGINRFKGSYKA